MKSFIKKGDIVILVCALAVCALLFLPRLIRSDGDLVARVYENGEIIHEINLSQITESQEIEINGAVILVENNAVSYIKADCPDKTCVRAGRLTKPGDTAACVPNKTVVTVTGEKKDKNIDVITY